MRIAGAMRLVTVLAGVMGAAGVALAAMAAHMPDAARLASASSMLLFHACAAPLAALLAQGGVTRRRAGLAAAFGLVAGASLFAGELSLRQFMGASLFPMVAPAGGTLTLASWLLVAVAAAWPRRA